MGPVELYPFQVRGVQALRDNIAKGIRAQILSSPTGSGKTEMGMEIMRGAMLKGSRAEFICDRQNLIRQTSGRFNNAGIRHGILMGGESVAVRENIRVSSAQTIKSRGLRVGELFVVDEVHEIRGSLLDAIIASGAVLIGLTATPFPKKLANYFKGIVNVATTNDLLADGYLCPFDVVAPLHEVDTSSLRAGSKGEWDKEEVSGQALKIVGEAVSEWERQVRERFDGVPQPTVAFACTIDDAEALAIRFQKGGHDFRVVSSRESSEANNETLKAYARGEFVGIVNCAVLSRGWDAPQTKILIDCYPLRKSLQTLIQRYGRVIRTAPGKDRALIIDHAKNWLGFRDDILAFYYSGPPALGDPSLEKATRKDKPTGVQRLWQVPTGV